MRVLVDRSKQVRERAVLPVGTAAGSQMLAELCAELRDAARDRHRSGVTQYTQALADDAVADVEQNLEILIRRGAFLDGAKDLHEPARADAARRALAARLVHVELRDAERKLDDAGAIVERGDHSGADEEALLAERVRIELRVELARDHHRERRASDHHCLQLAAVRDAAADVVDQMTHGDAVRRLVDARLRDVAGKAEEPR